MTKKLIGGLLAVTLIGGGFALYDSYAYCHSTTPSQTEVIEKYTCPMHPKVISDKPGKCPKCGMNLVPVKPAQVQQKYTCPMHPKVISDKPGKCPKCGMNLVHVKPTQVQQKYTCPMHPEVISDKAEKCPKCGMNLVLVKPTGQK